MSVGSSCSLAFGNALDRTAGMDLTKLKYKCAGHACDSAVGPNPVPDAAPVTEAALPAFVHATFYCGQTLNRIGKNHT